MSNSETNKSVVREGEGYNFNNPGSAASGSRYRRREFLKIGGGAGLVLAVACTPIYAAPTITTSSNGPKDAMLTIDGKYLEYKYQLEVSGTQLSHTTTTTTNADGTTSTTQQEVNTYVPEKILLTWEERAGDYPTDLKVGPAPSPSPDPWYLKEGEPAIKAVVPVVVDTQLTTLSYSVVLGAGYPMPAGFTPLASTARIRLVSIVRKSWAVSWAYKAQQDSPNPAEPQKPAPAPGVSSEGATDPKTDRKAAGGVSVGIIITNENNNINVSSSSASSSAGN